MTVEIFFLQKMTVETFFYQKMTVETSLLTENDERWGAGVDTQKNIRGKVGGWGRVPFNEPYAPSLSTIYDGA